MFDITIPAWTEQALCAQVGPELWFPEPGGSIKAATDTCARCPVQAECLDYSLVNDEHFGIWGGRSELDRRRARRARKAAA